jgi:hypothetical protein
MGLEVVGLMEERGQAYMSPRSLLPRPQGVSKKNNQSRYFIATPHNVKYVLDMCENDFFSLTEVSEKILRIKA